MPETLIYGFACEDCNVGWTSPDPAHDKCWRCGKTALPRPGYVMVEVARDLRAQAAAEHWAADNDPEYGRGRTSAP